MCILTASLVKARFALLHWIFNWWYHHLLHKIKMPLLQYVQLKRMVSSGTKSSLGVSTLSAASSQILRTAVSNPPLILSVSTVHVDRTSKHLNQTSTINSQYLFLYSRKNNWNIQYCLLRISDQKSILISTHREFHNCPFYSVVAVLSADGLVSIVFTLWVCECLCMCPRGKIRDVIQHELQQRGFWTIF